MESVCYRAEELAEVLDLDRAHPRRMHLGSCPRCRARLATYQEFRSAPPAVTGDPLEAALSHLGRALDEEIHGKTSTRPREGTVRAAPSWLSWPRFRVWILRPAFALATILLAVALVDSLRERSPEPGSVLRADNASERPFEIEAPREQRDGALELRWSEVPGAEFYRVRLLTPALEELATFDAPGSSLRLETERVRQFLPTPGTYAVIVTALSEGDEIDQSRPRSFQWRSETPE